MVTLVADIEGGTQAGSSGSWRGSWGLDGVGSG